MHWSTHYDPGMARKNLPSVELAVHTECVDMHLMCSEASFFAV